MQYKYARLGVQFECCGSTSRRKYTGIQRVIERTADCTHSFGGTTTMGNALPPATFYTICVNDIYLRFECFRQLNRNKLAKWIEKSGF